MVWDGELRSGGLGMSHSQLKGEVRRKLSRSRGQHPTQLPTTNVTRPFRTKKGSLNADGFNPAI